MKNFIATAKSESTLKFSFELDVFNVIYSIFADYSSFNLNNQDQKQRQEEKNFIDDWIYCVVNIETSSKYIDYFSKKFSMSSLLKNKSNEALEKCILDKLLSKNSYSVQNILAESGGVEKIFPRDQDHELKKKLFDKDSEFWCPVDKSPAIEILKEAKNDANIQINSIRLLQLIVSCYQSDSGKVDSFKIGEFIKEESLIELIWNAATSNPLQCGAFELIQNLRNFLISRGIDEQRIPVPEWQKNDRSG